MITLLREQEPELLASVRTLAEAVKEIPPDPAYTPTVPAALLVGGFVRDVLLGKHPKDADVEVYGVSPERLETLLGELFGTVNTVGKAFGILKVPVGEGLELDVSIPRRESKAGRGHTGFKTESDPSLTIQEAAARRDFSLNALAMDAHTGVIFDPHGGVEDIERKRLRATDSERFQDDPLRVLRGVQFAARLGFTVEPSTMELMRTMVERGDLDELSKERVTEEWKKLLLKAERPSVGLALMRDLGILEKYAPEVAALEGVPQEAEWHPEGDVWIHTNMVVDAAAAILHERFADRPEEERLSLMVGALCHDFGKPATTREEDGRLRSKGHEDAGVEPARAFLARFTFGGAVERAAVAIARDHLKPGVLYREKERGRLDERQYANAIRKLLRRVDMPWDVFLAASEADSRGRGAPAAPVGAYLPGEAFAQAVREGELDKAAATPLLAGRDLIALGLEPGPFFTELIRRAEAARDAGTITTKEEALALAKEWLKEEGSRS